MKFSMKVKKKLLSIIEEMDKYHWFFTKCPERDFWRILILTIPHLPIHLLIIMLHIKVLINSI